MVRVGALVWQGGCNWLYRIMSVEGKATPPHPPSSSSVKFRWIFVEAMNEIDSWKVLV